MAKLRLGLVGAGSVAEDLAAELRGAEAVEVTAVADAEPERARRVAQLLSCAAVDSSEDLLVRADVDAVYLAVPTFLGAMLAQAAARAGKHVLIEPPGAANPDEALHALQLARDCGVRLCVALADRYRPVWQRVRETIAGGTLGPLQAVHVQRVVQRPAGWGEGWRSLRLQAGGGLLLGEVLPLLDVVHWATGLHVERVFAEHEARTAGIEVEDTAVTTIGYRDGAVGSVAASWSAPGGAGPLGDGGVRIIGARGQLVTDGQRLWAFAEDWAEVALPPVVSPRARLLDDFARALAVGAPAPVADDAGLEAMKVVGAAYSSRRLGRPVRPDEVLQKVVMATWTTVG